MSKTIRVLIIVCVLSMQFCRPTFFNVLDFSADQWLGLTDEDANTDLSHLFREHAVILPSEFADELNKGDWAKALALLKKDAELLSVIEDASDVLRLIERDILAIDSSTNFFYLEDLAQIVCTLGKKRNVWPSKPPLFSLSCMLYRSSCEALEASNDQWFILNTCLAEIVKYWYVPRLQHILWERWARIGEVGEMCARLYEFFASYLHTRISLASLPLSVSTSQDYYEAVKKGDLGGILAFLHVTYIHKKNLWDHEKDPLEVAWAEECIASLDCFMDGGIATLFPFPCTLSLARAEKLRETLRSEAHASLFKRLAFHRLLHFIATAQLAQLRGLGV